MTARFFRNILAGILSAGAVSSVSAQDASRVFVEPMGWSVGMNVGMSDLWGNVGTQSVIAHYTNSKAFDKPCFIGGMLGRYTIHPCLAIRMMLNGGALYATDAWNYDLAKAATSQGDDAFQRYARHQDAKDYIIEASTLFEFTPFRTNPESRMAHRRGQMFFGAGVGGFYFVPYSTAGTSTHWVATYNLHLEGQGWGAGYPANYSLFQPCIPIVVGYKWDLGQHLNLGIEWMYRLTFCKYLDGVSNTYIDTAAFSAHLSPNNAALAESIYDKGYQYNLEPRNAPGNMRGTPNTNDSYSTITITFYYKVKNRMREWWRTHN